MEQSNTPNPNDQPASAPESILPPEVLAASESLMGIGAAATGGTLDSPIKGTGPGWLGRRWDNIKGLFHELNPVNNPGAQAAVAAGETFSKWDKAKAVVSDFANATVLTGSMVKSFVVGGLALHHGRDRRAANEFQRFGDRLEQSRAGVSNRVIRRKMATATMKEYSLAKPVDTHLQKFSRPVRATIDRQVQWERWKNQRRVEINVAQMIGASALGAAVDFAWYIAQHH